MIMAGGHGQGRLEAGRRDLLDLPAALLRPAHPRRRLQNLRVTICIDRAGLVGDDGKTHQGVFDISYTRVHPEHDRRRAARTRTSCSTCSARPSTPGGRSRSAIRAALGARRRSSIAELEDDPDRQGRDPAGGPRPDCSSPTARWSPVAARGGRGARGARHRLRRRQRPLRQAARPGAAPARSPQSAPRILTLEEHLAIGGFGSAACSRRSTARACRPTGLRSTRSPTSSSSTAPRPSSAQTSSSTSRASSRRSSRSTPTSAAPVRTAAGARRDRARENEVRGDGDTGESTATSPGIQVEKLLVAGLRGFCAGVVRAIDVVEKALEVVDGPVYVRKEIIHNRYVVDELREQGRPLRRGSRRGAGRRLAHLLRPRHRAGGPRERAPRRSCGRSTRPARSSRRCTSRRSTTRGRATRSSSSATTTTTRRSARSARRPTSIRLVETTRGRRDGHGARPRPRRLPDADDALDRRHARDPRGPEAALPEAQGARPSRTSATRRRTGRTPSRRWRRTSTCCSCSARRTAPTRSACARSRAPTASRRT